MKHIFRTLSFAIAALTLGACTVDNGSTVDLSVANISFRLKTPVEFSRPPATRAMDFRSENAVDDIHVLVFDQNKKLVDIAAGMNLASAPLRGEASATVTLPPSMGAETRKLVVLGNCVDILTSTIGTDNTSTYIGQSYDVVSAAVNTSLTGQLYASGGAIPMWGETGYFQVTGGNSNQQVNLLRAIARIDVGLGQMSYDSYDHTYSWNGLDASGVQIPFSIASVCVIRPNDHYAVIPLASNITGTTASLPTVPTGTGSFNLTDSQNDFTYNTVSGNITQTIYVPEADVIMNDAGMSGDANHNNRMAIVVGGYYAGSSLPTYYRLDFCESDGQIIDVLRNHCYLFAIAGVSGRGFATVEEAAASLSVNMQMVVLDWDQTNMGKIVFDGANTLSSSKETISLYKNAYSAAATGGENTLVVYTDYSTGWAIEKIVDAVDGTTAVSWLGLSPSTGAANSKVSAFVIAQQNTTGAARSAIIWIEAGRLRFPVRVNQSTTAIPLSLTLTSGTAEVTEMDFAAAVGVIPASQTLNVKWAPTNLNATVATAKDANGSVAFAATGAPTGGMLTDPGTKSYTIAPPAMTASEMGTDPFYTKASKVDFSITDGETTVTKSVVLKQVVYSVVVNPAAYYVMNGSTYTLPVRSNAPWYIKSIVETGRSANVKMISNKTTDSMRPGTASAGNTSSAGDALTFTVANTPGNWGTIAVTFASPDGKFPDKTITLVMAAKAIKIIGLGVATSNEGGDKYNLVTVNSATPSNQQGYTNATPQKMFTTAANFGTTPTSKVICEPFVTNWYNQNANTGANYTMSSGDDMLNWAIQQNPDLLWIGGNVQWGDDTSLRIKQEFLDKGKTVVCGIQEYATMRSMIKMILGYATDSNGQSTGPTSGWAYSVDNQYSTVAGATYQFADVADPILEGPFGNLRNKYWGTQWSGSYAFAVQGNSTNLITTYSSGLNQSGGGTPNINGYPPIWTTCFRAKNTNWIWICDDGFVRNDSASSTNTSPFYIDPGTFAPATRAYGGTSPQQQISNSAFIANMLAWVVARNPK